MTAQLYLENQTRDLRLASEVQCAFSITSRLIGLLGRSSLPKDTALWLKPCDSIHTWFMKFSIDVIFVDQNLVVKKIVRDLKPWKLLWPVRQAHSVFELNAGSLLAESVQEGDQLYVGH